MNDVLDPNADYSVVTETTGDSVSREALSMLLTRYRFATELAKGKTVLEVACGTGSGLGYLAGRAAGVVGGDLAFDLLRRAHSHYRGRVPLLRLDAHHLPFRQASFDVILLYEAIYYLQDPAAFLAECQRILRLGGCVVICTANREWEDFNPSILSIRYYSVSELRNLLESQGYSAEFFGAFPATKKGARDHAVSWIKRMAVALGVIPKTMKWKAPLKRVFLGNLYPVPGEIADQLAPYCPPVAIGTDGPSPYYKVLYAVAKPR